MVIGFDEDNLREYVSSAEDDDEATDPIGPSGEPFEEDWSEDED